MARRDERNKERFGRIDVYHKQLNDRILNRWLSTQAEQFHPKDGDYLPRSRFVELRLYVHPVLREFIPVLALTLPRDVLPWKGEPIVGDVIGRASERESAQDWYLNDALLHLEEFPEAKRTALEVQGLVQKHNEEVKAFVDFEDTIARKLKAISIETMGGTFDEQPEPEQFNLITLLWYFDKKHQKDSALGGVKVMRTDEGVHTIYFMWGSQSSFLARTKDAPKSVQLPILIDGWWDEYEKQRTNLDSEIQLIASKLAEFKKPVGKLSYKFVYGLPLHRTCGYEDTLK